MRDRPCTTTGGAALNPLEQLRSWFEELVEGHRELVDDLEEEEKLRMRRGRAGAREFA